MGHQIRQGDVLLIPVGEIPKDVKEIDRDSKDRVVLAYGEVTGHAHAFHDRGVHLWQNPSTLERWLDVKDEDVMLRHEEHTHHQVPKGKYKVVIQREVDLYSRRAIPVMD